MYNIVVLSSSGGGNFDVVANNQRKLDYNVSKLIVDRECGAIEKAKKNNIKYEIVEKESIINDLISYIPKDTNLVVLLGWLTILPETFLDKCKCPIINMHPSLLPLYGGMGMYGVKVHEAVMKNKEEYTGCTVHYVTSKVDSGEIILQKKIKVDYDKTPWQMGGEVFKLENKIILEAILLLKDKADT